MQNKTYQPVIIIGAPRSGTNMLRDVLCSFESVGTWPCDEINYIWRHGNVGYKTDEFTKDMATPEIKRFIKNEFDKLANKYNLNVVVEKTCANSLRVPFVNEVISDAKYIFIYRDGIDAAGSAKKRWTAKLDIPYIMKKARYVPLSDLPYYGSKYLFNRVYRLISKEKRLAFWGPQFNGLEEALEKYTLEEVAALQWKRCVDLSEKAFKEIEDDRVIRVKYEDFVTKPNEELKKILDFISVEYDETSVLKAVENVTAKSIGKGRQNFTKNEIDKIYKLISDSLKRYGYE